MNSRIKVLESLVQEAGRKIKRLERENSRLLAELQFFREDAARFQKVMQENQLLLREKEKVKKRLEKIASKLDKVGPALS